MTEDELLKGFDEHPAFPEAHAEYVRSTQAGRGELEQMRLRGERSAQDLIRTSQELIDESRAGRHALIAMIDELNGSGPSADA